MYAALVLEVVLVLAHILDEYLYSNIKVPVLATFNVPVLKYTVHVFTRSLICKHAVCILQHNEFAVTFAHDIMV